MPHAVVSSPRSTRARRALAALTTSALVATALSVPTSLWTGAAHAHAAAASATGSFSLAGGPAGRVDPRTGQMSLSVSLGTSGAAAVPVVLTWQQLRAAASIDRSGWGAGWSIGTSFVNTAGAKRVYPGAGGSYLLDSTEASGLKDYKLHDLKFATKSGTLTSSGGTSLSYSYTLTYDDGRIDYFDTNGNLIARVDRFGNQTDLAWRARANNVWQPTSITDVNGLTTTFDYSTTNVVKVISPRRSDGVVATTTVALTTASGVQSVTDPVGQKTSFGYTSVTGAPKPLLTQVTAPSGAKSVTTYQSPTYEPSLVAVRTQQITDADGNPLSPAQKFSIDPTDSNNRHNFTGYPNHLSTGGGDVLFESGDANYTYNTSLTVGSTTTLSTYDALGRLTSCTTSVEPANGGTPIVATVQTAKYDAPVQVPGNLPANYAKPNKVLLTQSSQTSAQGIVSSTPRTTTTSMSYDDHGRLVSATDEIGATTTTTYDGRFGEITDQTTTGKDGAVADMANTLTGDGRSIKTTITSVGQPSKTPTARQVLDYDYDPAGRLITRTLSWAPGAEPAADEPGGGPANIVTKFARSFDAKTATEILSTTIADGTAAAQTTHSDLDLVTGEVTSTSDGLGRTTMNSYDALGRRTKTVTPSGLVTTSSYTPTTTTQTGPTGLITRTTRDLLGRTTTVTDNVRNEALVSDPAARTLNTSSYSADGTSMTATDEAGRVTTTTLDPFGRTVSQTDALGITHLTSYDNGADHDKVDSVLPNGATSPTANTVSRYDDANREVQSNTTYAGDSGSGAPVGFLADTVTATSFNGLGQTDTSTASDLTVTADQSGAGGTQVGATAKPNASTDFPGAPMTATTTRDLTGAATSRTLTSGSEVSKAVAGTYDAAGNIVATTDPDGRVTRYTYNAGGQVLTKTDPSGTVTTYTYGATTGVRTAVTVASPGKPTRKITYTYAPSGGLGAGRVATISDGTATITYGYDADGHRIHVAYPDGTSTSATYSDQGQVLDSTDVTGAVTTFTYYPTTAVIKSAVQKRGAAVLASVTYTYDSLGRLDTTTRGNGTVTKNTYTANNLVATQTTTGADGTVIESHSYTYNAHREPATRTDTYPAGSSVAVPLSSTNTWTTSYAYDAYDRLIRSAVYAGPLVDGKPSGLAATSTGYTVDVAGDVVTKSVTTRLPGPRPIPVTTTTTNTIDPAGRLTSQQVDGTTMTQTYDDDGRVLSALNGNITTYTADGAPATVTLPNGSKTVYAYWPDGTRRSASTTGADGRKSTISFHYGTDGNLVNDTTADAATGSGTATTASYLLTAGREARTLLPGTATTGAASDIANSPITTGIGVGYYLRDRHSSVTGLVDSSGALTGTYVYSDYGAPARADGSALRVTAAVGGRANPYTYLGASPASPFTSPVTGLLVFTLRSYNPVQGRFTTPDPVDRHNLYQAFETNPVLYADLAGGISTFDICMDVLWAAVFLVTAVASFGAAAVAVGLIGAAAEAVVEASAAVVTNVIVNAAAGAANLGGAVTSSMLAADGIRQKTNDGKGYFDSQQLATISTANSTFSITGGVLGAGLGAEAVIASARGGAAAAADLGAARSLMMAGDEADSVEGVLHADQSEHLYLQASSRPEVESEVVYSEDRVSVSGDDATESQEDLPPSDVNPTVPEVGSSSESSVDDPMIRSESESSGPNPNASKQNDAGFESVKTIGDQNGVTAQTPNKQQMLPGTTEESNKSVLLRGGGDITETLGEFSTSTKENQEDGTGVAPTTVPTSNTVTNQTQIPNTPNNTPDLSEPDQFTSPNILVNGSNSNEVVS